MKKKIVSLVVLITVSLSLALADEIKALFFETPFERTPPCEVIRVVDGDTIIVDMDGVKERVRFIGLDAPESVHPDESKNTEEGRLAALFTTEMLEGKMVTLEFDVQERDEFGRILAYVYLEEEMFNKILIREGHAQVVAYPPNVRYQEEFRAIEKKK